MWLHLVLHGTVVCGGGSLKALAVNSLGPCTWLFSALRRVWVDVVFPSQIHDDNFCHLPEEHSPSAASIANEIEWYAWRTDVWTCSGSQTNFPVSFPVKVVLFPNFRADVAHQPGRVAHVSVGKF